MSKFRNLVENLNDIKNWLNQTDSSFAFRLKRGCGITDDINKGGLILPDGTLINCFPDSHLMHYDSLPFIYPERISPEEHGSFSKEDMFDDDVIDNNIIRYSINHSIQEAYVKLPSKNITKAQLDKLQDIFMSLKPGQRIPVMIEDNIFKIVYADKSSVAKDILNELSKEYTFTEGDKKIFDKDSGYNSSKDEQYIYEKLKEKWPDVKMSYTDDRFVNPETHRHFQCDFYIPSKDWFINYNKIFTHGRRKYNPDDPNCQEDVKWLESMSKPGNYYERALKQWTITDPIKRKVAEENGIKLIELFNLDEFERWFANPELSYEEYKYAPDSMQYNSDEYFKQKARGRDIYGADSDPYAA